MGCPGSTCPVFTCIFPIFFLYYNLFLGKLKEKLTRKARVNTDASISVCAHATWASNITS